MSQLAEKLYAGQKKVITAEITPPKGAGIKKLVQHADLLKPCVDAINITDCQRALVKMASWAACRVLLDRGIEPVYQLTCRDRNSIALQSDLMGASAIGIPNVLCLTGDPVKVGDSPSSKSVFEVESVRLLELVRKLQSGRDAGENKMNAPTKFFVGAVVNPTMQALGSQYARMEKKIDAGACFFQTQANYDISDLKAFLLETKKLNTKVLTGILVLHSFESAKFIQENIPGIRMPNEILERFRGVAGDEAKEQEVGVCFAAETMLQTEDFCDGFHIMTIRMEGLVPRVVEAYHGKRTTKNSSPSMSSAAGR